MTNNPAEVTYDTHTLPIDSIIGPIKHSYILQRTYAENLREAANQHPPHLADVFSYARALELINQYRSGQENLLHVLFPKQVGKLIQMAKEAAKEQGD